MIAKNPLFISSQGELITCSKVDSGRIFRSYLRSRCVYSSDLHFAKAYLDNLEFSKSLPDGQNKDSFCQLKTTLKWSSDRELSALEMA